MQTAIWKQSLAKNFSFDTTGGFWYKFCAISFTENRNNNLSIMSNFCNYCKGPLQRSIFSNINFTNGSSFNSIYINCFDYKLFWFFGIFSTIILRGYGQNKHFVFYQNFYVKTEFDTLNYCPHKCWQLSNCAFPWKLNKSYLWLLAGCCSVSNPVSSET